MKGLNFLLSTIWLLCAVLANAQEIKTRGISTEEYALSKTAQVKDPDKDTYVKLNQQYVLDREESKKPYFITGDDGLRKRIDLYKFIARDSMQQLGTILIYTNEKGKKYTACIPSAKTEGKIWARYFEDIHAIDKEEKNFVLKLTYVLSREFSTLAGRTGGGKTEEDGTYGNEICFPGEGELLMADGTLRKMNAVKPGDVVVNIDPVSGKQTISPVTSVSVHQPMNYAITTLTLVNDVAKETASGNEVTLSSRTIAATPNHPVVYGNTSVQLGSLPVGSRLLCKAADGKWLPFKVLLKNEKANGVQPVFSVETASGNTLVVNGVVVLQKGAEQVFQ